MEGRPRRRGRLHLLASATASQRCLGPAGEGHEPLRRGRALRPGRPRAALLPPVTRRRPGPPRGGGGGRDGGDTRAAAPHLPPSCGRRPPPGPRAAPCGAARPPPPRSVRRRPPLVGPAGGSALAYHGERERRGPALPGVAAVPLPGACRGGTVAAGRGRRRGAARRTEAVPRQAARSAPLPGEGSAPRASRPRSSMEIKRR